MFDQNNVHEETQGILDVDDDEEEDDIQEQKLSSALLLQFLTK